jgi:hypothetical protein
VEIVPISTTTDQESYDIFQYYHQEIFLFQLLKKCSQQHNGVLTFSCILKIVRKRFGDSKGVIKSSKLQNRQYNGQQKRDKRANNYLQNTTQKTKDRATRSLLKTGCELMCSGREAVPDPLVAPVLLLLLHTRWQVTNEERSGLWIRQTEHIRGHLWQIFHNG